MKSLLGILPILLGLAGCGGRAPEPIKPGDAPRVLAIARDLDAAKKTKQAIDAYQQVVRYFPGTPEAIEAAKRISQVQRAAILKGPVRKSK